MSVALDRAMIELSLDDEDVPFKMPFSPAFNSCEKNHLSLIGRALNPECQKMSSLIINMPRKWQKEGKIRGVALSKEQFQFIFKNEYDLVEVLEKGVQTFNEWALVLERWVQSPPEGYLQFIPLWVQISKIPVNYYTEEAISALGDLIGEVQVVAFDPEKPQTQDFVRVKVIFDVSRPLRKFKVVELPDGTTTKILFHYENIQKRCFSCQRLNHEQDYCPLLARQKQSAALARKEEVGIAHAKATRILTEADPLFGVLTEDQVNLDVVTGRPKIAKEVLDEMRRYLLVANGDDRVIREERVKASVKETKLDPITQKTILRLEKMPLVTNDVLKGKGLVFDSKDEARLLVFVWALESMVSHRIDHVIFTGDFSDLIKVINRPKAWPSFIFHSNMLLKILDRISHWSCVSEAGVTNRCASIIAQSATVDRFSQSYVALGAPRWLAALFEDERVSSSS